MIYTK